MATNAKQQGYLVVLGTVLTMDMEVWPVHIEDPAKSEAKPYPRYKGSARVEGTEARDDQPAQGLYEAWITKGFQPCVLKVKGVVLARKDGEFDTFHKDLYLAALVRYSSVGRPALRVITKAGGDKLTSTYMWSREPVKAQGETAAERRAFVRDLVFSTKPVQVEQPATTEPTKPAIEADPFAA